MSEHNPKDCLLLKAEKQYWEQIRQKLQAIPVDQQEYDRIKQAFEQKLKSIDVASAIDK